MMEFSPMNLKCANLSKFLLYLICIVTYIYIYTYKSMFQKFVVTFNLFNSNIELNVLLIMHLVHHLDILPVFIHKFVMIMAIKWFDRKLGIF